MDDALSLLGSKPIAGGEPAGVDARYEPEYAAVLTEIDKLSFSGQGAAVSWPAVESNACAILSNKSKDLQIAAYLAVALWQNRGPEGLLPGVLILSGLLDRYWQTAWPPVKRMRGRVNSVDWWHERTGAYLHGLIEKNASLDAQSGQALLVALQKLDEQCASLLSEAVPLRDLVAAVRRLLAPPPEPDSAPVGPSPAATAPVAGAAPGPELPQDAASLRRLFVDVALRHLPLAQRADPADPEAWRLLRLVVWGGIAALPPVEEGQTLLPTPDLEQYEVAGRLLAAGKFLEAAFAAEELFVAAPFYLDAQRLAHRALTGAGGAYAAAAGAVEEECARFALRLPGVERLRFTDGAAFAAPETIDWLHAATLARQGKQGGPGDGARAPTPEDSQLWRDARKLQAENNLAGALDLLDAAKSASPAMNVRLRLLQLRILCDARADAAAVALANALLAETAERALDAWDPELALEALLAVRRALTRGDAHDAAALRAAHSRIARLRPSAALADELP